LKLGAHPFSPLPFTFRRLLLPFFLFPPSPSLPLAIPFPPPFPSPSSFSLFLPYHTPYSSYTGSVERCKLSQGFPRRRHIFDDCVTSVDKGFSYFTTGALPAGHGQSPIEGPDGVMGGSPLEPPLSAGWLIDCSDG